MKKEFKTLSDKIFESEYMSGEFLLKFDVKEFIKLLNKKIEEGKCPDCDLKVKDCKCNYKKKFVTIDREFIDKLAGKELSGDEK